MEQILNYTPLVQSDCRHEKWFNVNPRDYRALHTNNGYDVQLVQYNCTCEVALQAEHTCRLCLQPY